MNKHHVRDKLSEYIDGMLNQEETSAVKEHLDRCPDCMEEYKDMVKIIGHMSRMETLETPDSFVEKVRERLEKESSLKKVVKGLFFPAKIKLPLEIAGLAAAALLVVYITGIREKQHVYELTFTQKTQSLAMLEELTGVLQEKKVDRDAKVDDTTPLSKKALPTAKPQDKKLDKREKGVEAEEATPQSIMEQPPSAPQEIKIEREDRGHEVEDAVSSNKLVPKRGELEQKLQKNEMERKAGIEVTAAPREKPQKKEESSVKIPDKERGEAKKVTPMTAISGEEKIQGIIIALAGKIIELEYNNDAQTIKSLLIEIPAVNYEKLIQTLDEWGEIRKPYPAIKERNQETMRVRIILQ